MILYFVIMSSFTISQSALAASKDDSKSLILISIAPSSSFSLRATSCCFTFARYFLHMLVSLSHFSFNVSRSLITSALEELLRTSSYFVVTTFKSDSRLEILASNSFFSSALEELLRTSSYLVVTPFKSDSRLEILDSNSFFSSALEELLRTSSYLVVTPFNLIQDWKSWIP